jgi:3-dehydroquinate synthase
LADSSDSLTWQQTDTGLSVSTMRRQTYSVILRPGALQELARYLLPVCESVGARSGILVTDENVAPLYAELVRAACSALELPLSQVSLPAGEGSKSWRALSVVVRHLTRDGAQRRTLVFALGGGVICDLVGFAASIYMRGLPYVNLPTTLMAQLDAAIGGKVGIDMAEGKNLLGAFHHPALVVIDPELLNTLPDLEIRVGLVEAVKIAILRSEVLFCDLERFVRQQGDRTATLDGVVASAIAHKLELLAPDPYERDLDRLLNLGHSLGHALESATGYGRFRHGEAVGMGIAFATRLAFHHEICTGQTQARILELLGNLEMPVHVPSKLVDLVWARMELISRIRNGQLREVVPRALGKCEIWRGELDLADFRMLA